MRVGRAYQALEFLQDALPPPMGYNQGANGSGYKRTRSSYYRMRSELLSWIKLEGGLLYAEEILDCAERLGLNRYGLNELSAYVERRPARGMTLHKMHMFYGGADVPHGTGHGHGSVFLKPDGSFRKFNFNILPASVHTSL
ncbi:MAG: hypothetical protein ABIM96_01450 [Candidatus Saccharimonas sp.]